MSTIRVDRITPYQSGSVAIEGLSISNLTIDGTLTASIQEGFVLVGGAGNVSKLAATSSFGGGGGSDITALNSFTASQEDLNGTFATTGSNLFIGNQEITGSILMSGSRFQAKVPWPEQDSEYNLFEPEPFTIEVLSSGSRTYGYNGIALEHYNDDFYDTYHNSIDFYFYSSSNFGDSTNFGSELNVGPLHTFFRMHPSGANLLTSENMGNISLNDLQDTRTRANIYATEVHLGAFRGDILLIGNTGSLNVVRGRTEQSGSLSVSGSTTIVGDMVLTGSLTISGSSTFRNIGPTILSGSVDISGSINSDGYELAASSTETIPVLNDSFDLDLVPSGSTTTFINKSLVLGDGKILVAGRFTTIDGHTTNDIARLNSDGTVDTSFAAPMFSGSSAFLGRDDSAFINTFTTQSDGKIVVGGNFIRVGEGGAARRGIARLNANGTLDTSFVTQSFESFASHTDGGVRDLVIQNDGKIIFVGDFTSGSRRVNSDGTLDTTFNINQGNNQPLAFNNGEMYSVALLDSGSEQAILIGGNFPQWGSYSYPFLVKLNPNGTLDFGFGGNNLDINDANSSDTIKKIKVGDDGYIYVAGKFRDTGIGNNAGFARITTTDEGDGVGAIENSLRTYISGSYVNDFDFYDGDKILLGGNFTLFGNPGFSVTSANRFAIIRQSTGGLVTNWSTDGLASKYNLNTGTVNSVTLLPNDNVLVGGTFTSASFPSTAREGLASLKLTGFGNVTTTTDYSITADTTQLLISSSNTYFSGNVNISGNLTASIQEGYVLVGGAGDVSKLTPTSSFGGGGDVFPYTGNAVISGSITISGSILQTGVGENNIFIGSGSGASNTSGPYNTFVGVMGGNDNTTGDGNTFIGASAGLANTTGGGNTFVGAFSAIANTTGANNSVLGVYAAESNTTGYNNIFIGNYAGGLNTTGFSNTFLGYGAGNGNITGNYNVAIGESAGSAQAANLTSIFIGAGANPQANLQSNQIVIGYNATGNGTNTTTIGNSSTTATYLRGALNLTHRTSPHIMSGSLNMSGSINVTSAVTASSFTGSFVGDGSGLTGVGSSLPSDILSSSFTNFTDYSQSVDTRISSIVTGTGFATTGSNTFVGNQIVTGSLILSSSEAIELRVVGDSVLSGSLTVTGSITAPGSGSLTNFVANPNTMRSIRGNGAGLYNLAEQSDGNMTFTLTRIGTRDLTGAITSNISGSTINGSFSDNTTTTSGEGRGARLRGFISGGVVTSVQIDTSTSTLGYEEYGQPASRQGIGYKAGDTVTIDQSLNQVTGSLTITLRQQDIDTYFGVDPRVSIDYKNYGILTAGGIISSGSVSIGAGVNTLGSINSIGAGSNVKVDSNYAIAVGVGNNTIDHTAAALFGAYHTSSASAQTIVGIASNASGIGSGAFIVGNGTNASNRSNLLVAQGNKVEISGSLNVSGSIIPNVGVGESTSSFSLGSSTAAWKDIWVSEGTIRFLDGEGNPQGTLSTTADGIQTDGDIFISSPSPVRVGRGAGTNTLNTIVGMGSLGSNTTGTSNTAVGASALNSNTTGYENTAMGGSSLAFNGVGYWNTAVGQGALYTNQSGSANTAVGVRALNGNIHSSANAALGHETLLNVSAGFGNTALGYQAGYYLSGSSNLNVYLGYQAGPTASIEENFKLYIDNQQTNKPLIGGDFQQREVVINGALDVTTLLTLSPRNPLPAGTLGSMAVSGSSLYFHNGSQWREVSLV